MTQKIATTKNNLAFLAGMEKVLRPIRGRVRMGLFYGPPGTGKTEAAHDYCMGNDAVYIRASSVESPSSFLRALCKELGEEPTSRQASLLFNQAVVKMAETRKPLIVDEVDYLTGARHKFVELLRDLNDVSNVAVIMIGMDNVDKKLAAFPHLVDRIRVKVKFEIFNAADIDKLAKELCPAPLEETAVAYIAEKSGGKLRLITEMFETAETLATRNKLKSVSAEILKQAEDRRARR